MGSTKATGVLTARHLTRRGASPGPSSLAGTDGAVRPINQADLIAHVVAEEMSLGEMTTLLKPMLHDPAVVLEPGDELLAVVHVESAAQLADLLGPAPAGTHRAAP